MLLVPNHHVIVPKPLDLHVSMAPIKSTTSIDTSRGSTELEIIMNGDTVLLLPHIPLSQYFVELYLDGVRILNPKYPTSKTMGIPFEEYNIIGAKVIFTNPITGTVKVIIDSTSTTPPGGFKIPVENTQSMEVYTQRFNPARWAPGRDSRDGATGANNPGGGGVIGATGPAIMSTPIVPIKYVNTELRVRVGDSLYCEPIVLSQPEHGYAKLSVDRKSMVYVPNPDYVGYDSFSYTLITQHGQIGMPKCIFIEVVKVKDVTSATGATGPTSLIYLPGIQVSSYINHYYGGDTTWFNITPYTSISSITTTLNQSWWKNSTISNEYRGYFYAPVTGQYTFTFETSNDSYMWIGPTAISGYDNTNALVNTSGHNYAVSISRSIALVGDSYYPIRVQWGANGISGNFISTFHSSAVLADEVQSLDNYLFHISTTTGF